MTIYGELLSNYSEIRERLKHPPNAVEDTGIDLRRKLIPAEQEPKKVLEPPPPVVIHMLFKIPRTKPSISTIEKAVIQHFKTSEKNLHCYGRTKEMIYPRHIFFYLCRVIAGHSFPRVAQRGCEFRRGKKRDHTTVLHAYRRIGRKIEQNNEKVIADIAALSKVLMVAMDTYPIGSPGLSQVETVQCTVSAEKCETEVI